MQHKFYKLTSENNKINKKIFFVIFRKIHGEIDWILPLINHFNKDHLFFAIIENEREIEVLKRNSFLYEKFINNFHGYFVESKYKNFFERCFLKIFQTFFKKNKYIRFLNSFNSKYYSTKYLIKKIKINFKLEDKITIGVFISYDKLFNNWENQFSIEQNASTFYFPSSCSLKPTQISSNVVSKTNIKNKFLLLSNELDIGYWNKVYPELNQYIIGYPRYTDNWIEKIQAIKYKSNTFRIYLSYRRDLPDEKWFEKAIEQLDKIKLILKKINKIFEIYVKLHPYTNQNELNNFLINEKNLNFILTNDHQQEICKSSNFSIHFFRSASIMESLSTKTPAIELWKLSSETFGSPYQDYNLSFFAKNEKELENYIVNLIKGDEFIKNEFSEKYKIFEKICLNNDPVNRFNDLLNLKINSINNKSILNKY